MAQYVILPSNSSMNYFPNNTLANFRVKLGKPLKFSGKYEVALVEIIYPHLHLSVEPQEASIMFLDSKNKNLLFNEALKTIVTSGEDAPSDIIEYLDAGIYSSHHEILKSLKPKFKKFEVDIKYKKERNRFAITGFGTGQKYEAVKMSSKFARILGFGDGSADAYTFYSPSEAMNMPDFTGGEHALFIYSSIVDHQIIGDTLAPLLRVVCPESKNIGNNMASEKYIKPYYVDIARTYIDVIDVQLRTTTGRFYPFIGGNPVILKLHFRPKQI